MGPRTHALLLVLCRQLTLQLLHLHACSLCTQRVTGSLCRYTMSLMLHALRQAAALGCQTS